MRLVVRCLLAAGVLASLFLPALPGRALAAESPRKPNIIIILTDDEDMKVHRYLPKTARLLGARGATFDQYFVSYSFCCPSRATTLRGQYAHNHRIVGNDEPAGGFTKFRALGHESSTIATWLRAAGYRTAMIGKYLNHYDPGVDAPAEGWDEWVVPGSYNYAYFDYLLNVNGRALRFGSSRGEYLTDVLTRHATAAIRRAALADQPLFLYLAPYAPHSPATAAPRHEGLFADETYPRSPAFAEADLSDKPLILREALPLEPWQLEAIDRHWRERLRAMQSVDDMVERVVATLAELGELERTYIVYASDNGFHMGEHGMFVGKTTPYDEDVQVPLIVRGPGIEPGTRVDELVVNNDLAPTFAAMAGVTPPAYVDGRSFLPLLRTPQPPWRQAFLIERRQRETHELTGAAAFDAIRTTDWLYVEYGSGERELYDLAADPHQLESRHDTADPELVARLGQRLAELAVCAGSSCRLIEDRPLEPAVAVSEDGQGAL